MSEPLQWQDIRNGGEIAAIGLFLQQQIPITWHQRTGIITLSSSACEELQQTLTNSVYIGTLANSLNLEKDLVLIHLGNEVNTFTETHLRVLLTRARLAFVLFGDRSLWENSCINSLFNIIRTERNLLESKELFPLRANRFR